MSAVNLYINEEKVSYEIRQDVIVIKEKGNVIFEFPIPNGYHLLGILDEGNNKKNIVITPYELKKPNYIPEGYGNLHLICEGCWEIDEKDETLYIPRRLHYVDTALLKPEHYLEVSDGQFQISQEEIPKSFWFSDQHRALMPEILDNSCYDIAWVEINKIPEYLKGFDPRCRLITEEECVSLFAFNEATDFTLKGYTKLTGIKPQYDSLPKFILGGNGYHTENWDKLALSREDRSVYRQLIEKNSICYRNRPIPSFITDDLRYANFIIPVIDEEAGKKILVK